MISYLSLKQNAYFLWQQDTRMSSIANLSSAANSIKLPTIDVAINDAVQLKVSIESTLLIIVVSLISVLVVIAFTLFLNVCLTIRRINKETRETKGCHCRGYFGYESIRERGRVSKGQHDHDAESTTSSDAGFFATQENRRQHQQRQQTAWFWYPLLFILIFTCLWCKNVCLLIIILVHLSLIEPLSRLFVLSFSSLRCCLLVVWSVVF